MFDLMFHLDLHKYKIIQAPRSTWQSCMKIAISTESETSLLELE